jgi:putative transposase
MLHEELDRCHGSCLLRRKEPRQIVVESLQHFDGARIRLGDWVVMPNHVHALMTPIGDYELEDVLGSIKKWTSRLIRLWLGDPEPDNTATGPDRNRPRFWQHDSYDRIVRDAGELAAFRNYIAENPGQAKLLLEGYTYGACKWLDAFAPRPKVNLK